MSIQKKLFDNCSNLNRQGFVAVENAKNNEVSHWVSIESKSNQLSLFQKLSPEGMSHSVEFYDSLCKYGSKIIKTKEPKLIEKNITFNHIDYKFEIRPALLKHKSSGEVYHYFPGPREEFVEVALRKLLTEQQQHTEEEDQGENGSRAASIIITLQQLRDELKRNGHTYNGSELNEALNILKYTQLSITGNYKDISGEFNGPIIELIKVYSKDNDLNKTFLKIRFHPLIQHAIYNDNSYHRYNYQIEMQLSSQLARWLLKRLYNRFRYAEFHKTYEIKATTVRNEGPVNPHITIRRILEDIKRALNELKKTNIIASDSLNTFEAYSFKPIYSKSSGGRPRLLDAYFTIHPSSGFIDDIKEDNRVSKYVSLS